MANETRYFIRKLGDETIIAKIENLSGYKYENGEWVSYPYVCKELFEDVGFDEITKEVASALIKKLDNK